MRGAWLAVVGACDGDAAKVRLMSDLKKGAPRNKIMQRIASESFAAELERLERNLCARGFEVRYRVRVSRDAFEDSPLPPSRHHIAGIVSTFD